MYKRIATIVLALLLPACATLVVAQTAGIVYPQLIAGTSFPHSGVKVGEKAIYTSTGVFAGDTIRTGAMSARVAFEGISVQMAPNSALMLAAVPDLASGSAVIATNRPMTLHIADREVLLVQPSILRIDSDAGMLSFSVQSGAAVIKENGTVTTLLQGQSSSRAIQSTSPSPSKEKTAGSNPGSSQRPVPTVSGRLIGRKPFWIVAGSVAVAGVAAGVLATRGEGSVSPSRP